MLRLSPLSFCHDHYKSRYFMFGLVIIILHLYRDCYKSVFYAGIIVIVIYFILPISLPGLILKCNLLNYYHN